MPGKIYTRRGDKGFTSLLTGERVSKTDPRIITLGVLDELSAIIGVTKSFSSDLIVLGLREIQEDIFRMAAEIGSLNLKGVANLRTSTQPRTKFSRLEQHSVEHLENKIDELSEKLPTLRNFLLPGGAEASAFLHLARTVCRRAESELVRLSLITDLNLVLIQYVNRLSDFLFICARYVNFIQNVPDEIVKGR
ncbi:MAG: cob(I)yrinic acid a,c-diamide adenosyltransferase [Candidatus Heimdallarchaeota archaeon]